MLRLTSFVVLLLSLSLSCAPATAQSDSTEDLYVIALEASLMQMAHEWGTIDDSNAGKRVRTDYRSVVVKIDQVIPSGLPVQVGSSQVEYLDHDELVQRAKRLRRPFAILEGVPMTVEGSTPVVTYRQLWVTFRKGMLHLGLSAWSKVYFRFDCQGNRFVVDRVQLGGI